jgi:hypothetical protein
MHTREENVFQYRTSKDFEHALKAAQAGAA